MWFYLILVVIILAVLAYIYGVFTPVTTFKDKLLNPHLIYFTFKGGRHQISDHFGKIKKDMGEHFKLATCFGIYYSNSSQPIQEYVVGFEVNGGQSNKVASFLLDHRQYNEARLKTTRYIGCTLPYINELSFLINVSKISEFFQLIKQDRVDGFKGLIERYHFLPFFGKTVELISPIDNFDQWNLIK